MLAADSILDILYNQVNLTMEEKMIKPTRGKILIKRLTRLKKYGSIWLASNKKEVYDHGVILALGDPPRDKWGKTIHWDFEVGNKIFYKRYSGKKWSDREQETQVFLAPEHIVAREDKDGLHAVGTMLLLKVEYDEKIGSIIIPVKHQAYNADFMGRVVSVGPEYPYKDIKDGDGVYFVRHEGFAVKTDDGTFMAMKEKWCCAKDQTD